MPKPIDNRVLRQIIENPKFAQFNSGLIEEAYDIMLRIAPTLATIPVVAAHWVHLALTHADVQFNPVTITELAEAEVAIRASNDLVYAREIAREAFSAGAVWAGSQETAGVGKTTTELEAFQEYWQGPDEEEET